MRHCHQPGGLRDDGDKKATHAQRPIQGEGGDGGAARGRETLSEIGQRYEVHPVALSQWKKEPGEHAATLFEGKRGPGKAAGRADEERLYEEIGRLKRELDWLEKKSVP